MNLVESMALKLVGKTVGSLAERKAAQKVACLVWTTAVKMASNWVD